MFPTHKEIQRMFLVPSFSNRLRQEYRYDGTLDGVRVGRFAPKPRLGTGTDGTSDSEKSPSNQQNVMEDKMISFFQKELNSSFKQLGEQRLFIKVCIAEGIDTLLNLIHFFYV